MIARNRLAFPSSPIYCSHSNVSLGANPKRPARQPCVVQSRALGSALVPSTFLPRALPGKTTRSLSLKQHTHRRSRQLRLKVVLGAPGMDLSTALACGLVALALYITWQVVRFATADADLNLLARGVHSPRAFNDKVVWITGASQGFGAILAKYMARHGAKLILSARNAEKLKEVAAACSRSSGDVVVLPLDLLGGEEALVTAAEKAFAAFGGAGVDFLIHNAGASQHALAEETTREVATALLQLNCLGAFALTRAALPHLLAQRRGRIVAVASMAAVVPSPGQAMYSASKMALWGYFSSLATEIADRGVSVTVCCPGPVSAGPGSPPRSVYGARGLVVHDETGGKGGRVAAERAATLVASAAAHGVDEAWICRHPVLLMGYLMRLCPRLAMLILRKVGPARAEAVRTGEGGYDVSAIVRRSAANIQNAGAS